MEDKINPCNRCEADPIRMGGPICFTGNMGYALMCPVCKRSSGYFASEERAIETWNRMNPSAP